MVDSIEWLIASGADVTARNRAGETPLRPHTRYAVGA